MRANEEEISFVSDTASMTIQKLRKAKNKSSIQEILDSIESSSSTYRHFDVFSYFELLPSFQHVTCQQSSSFDNMQHIRRLVSPQLFIQLLLHFALAASDFLQQFICMKSVTSELILRAVLQCTATLTMTFLMMNAFNEMNVAVELYQHEQTALILRCTNALINMIRNYKSKQKK